MRIGVFGDIHNNFEALKASYEIFDICGCDQIVCTGDIVGYGASPKECIDFFIEHDIVAVKGNHDYYTTQIGYDWNIQPYAKYVIKWMQDTLDTKYIDWLDKLPYKYEIENVEFVHASLESANGEAWPYILDSQTAMFHFFMQSKKFCFYGHTHIPLLFTINKGRVRFELLSSQKFKNSVTSKYLLNPGSVGQPRDFNSKASIIIFDTETLEVELYRVDYDVSLAQKKIIKAGLPRELADRLHSGR